MIFETRAVEPFRFGDPYLYLDKLLPINTIISCPFNTRKASTLKEPKVRIRFEIISRKRIGASYAYIVTQDYHLVKMNIDPGFTFTVEHIPSQQSSVEALTVEDVTRAGKMEFSRETDSYLLIFRYMTVKNNFKKIETTKSLEEIIEEYNPMTVFNDNMEILYDRSPKEEDFVPTLEWKSKNINI